MAIANKEKLLQSCKRRYLDVEAPELETSFRLQSLNGREMSIFASRFADQELNNDSVDQLSGLLSLCLVDEAGARLITTKEEEKQLAELEFGLLVKLGMAAQKHNRIDQLAVEDSAKN